LTGKGSTFTLSQSRYGMLRPLSEPALPLLPRLLTFVRDADWLDGKRTRAYSLILLVVSAVGFAAWIVMAPHGIDRSGKPLGTDFMSFYAASKLALSGHAADAWSPAAHQAAEDGIFGRSLGYWAFFYPPAYLLLCWPLALLPYGAALVAWLGTTTAAALVVLRRWTRDVPWTVLLAFPALWLNLGNGQNAALFTAILAGGCLLLPHRPILAGLVFGLLVMKPQLALALPLLLAVSGRWKTVCAMGLGALGLCAAAWLLVGADGYAAFLHNGGLAAATLDRGLVSPDKMQSVFAALRLLGAPSPLALFVHAVVALGVMSTAAWIAWRYKPEPGALCALMVTATLPLSPFLLDYDLMLLAIPLGWMAAGRRDGFRPWEKTALLVLFVWPLFARAVAANLHLPLTPLLLLGLYIVVVRRVAQPSAVLSNAPGSNSSMVKAA